MKETTAKKAPKKRKERDLGTPTVIVRYLDETPEQVAQNRRCVEAALDMMWRKTYGLHLTNFDWGEKPEGYGRTRVTHPKIQILEGSVKHDFSQAARLCDVDRDGHGVRARDPDRYRPARRRAAQEKKSRTVVREYREHP